MLALQDQVRNIDPTGTGMRLSQAAELVDEAGGRFGSQWTVHALLGVGCSARVMLARSRTENGGDAACKVASQTPRGGWSRIVRCFEREADLMRRCNHPNIVQCLGLYQSCTDIVLVLSLASGGDCQQLLQRHGALSERAANAIVHQLSTALQYLHTVPRVLHRDVKLENILVQNVGGAGAVPRVQLCDFGHSCLLDEPNLGCAVNDRFRGTEGYAAPEVLAGQPWTVAADAWGVGVVYYALLANELLRWKSGSPDISTKTSRAFAQVATSTKMLVKALLLPEMTKRATLPALIATLSHPTAAAAEEEPARVEATEGLRRIGRASAGGLRRNAYSLHENLSCLGHSATVAPLRSGLGGARHGATISAGMSSSSSIAENMANISADNSPLCPRRGVPGAESIDGSPM